MRAGDIAIDIGTANTLVYQEGSGIVFNEPAVAAVGGRGGSVVAIGERAWEMVAETPASLVAVRPLKRGSIVDYDLTLQILRLVMRQVGLGRLARPRTLVCVPAASTDVERRAMAEATKSAGARTVALIDQPLAAAIGARLPIEEPIGSLVVDVGGGSTEAAMIASGGIISKTGLSLGGFDMDAAIVEHIRSRYDVAIGDRTAERVKIAIGSASSTSGDDEMEVTGRELASGAPRTLQLTSGEVRDALTDSTAAIAESTKSCLADSPPELAYDVLEGGIFLTGGGAMLKGLDLRIAEACEVPVHVADKPLEAVVLGAGRCLGLDRDVIRAYAATPRRR
ncbi:MAG: rod shape-determining protein [Actinomycetota bacterium]